MPDTLAAVFGGTPRQIKVQHFPIPAPAGAETLVRVLGCTLCGSDLHSFAGHRSVAVPTVLGHEIVGEITAFGPSVVRQDWCGTELCIGDRVTWAVVAACGECFYCRRNLWPKCLSATKYGHERFTPGRELLGGLAGHCLLVAGTAILKLPDELPLEVACPANCATATVAAALDAAGDLTDAVVCITGAGLLGLTACAMARVRGAAEVICVDVSADRLARTESFGATRPTNPEMLATVIHDVTGGHGVDVVVELSGATPALEAVWPLVRHGGTIVLVGAVFPVPPLSVLPEQVVRRQLTLRGVHNYSPRHLQAAVRFLAQNHERYPFAELVSEWVPLAEVGRAFELAGDPARVRVGVRV
jgi:putative phosphonate catabolism associated alcohol dehydrogenase